MQLIKSRYKSIVNANYLIVCNNGYKREKRFSNDKTAIRFMTRCYINYPFKIYRLKPDGKKKLIHTKVKPPTMR